MSRETQRRPHGERIRCPGGYLAYVPEPLPPKLEWHAGLVAALSAADRVIGRLAGEGRRLPSARLLIRPFLRREAVLSSRIEGTRTTLGELLEAEADTTVERGPADLREVANCMAALEYGASGRAELPLSLRLIRELHAKLMRDARAESAAPGEFRRSQNWIGPPGCGPGDASFVPPPPDRLMDCLGPWEKFLHDNSLPPLVQAALVHSQFEAIHPFLDGNGRIGRLLTTLLLTAKGVLPVPLLYLSAYFEATRNEYYERLLAVTRQGAWEEWTVYFLTAVAHQAKDALARIQKIDEQLSNWRRRLAPIPSKVPDQAVDLLVENPFWTVKKLAERLGVAFTTAQRAINRLEAHQIVERTTEARRNRVYCARAILEILEEPPGLTATRRAR